MAEKRDRRWLFNYLNAAPPRTARAKRYLTVIGKADRPLDLSDPGTSPTEANRSTAYGNSREGAALIGRKAFLYRTPGTPQHQDPSVLEQVLAGLRTFAAHQDAQGRFIWGEGYYYNWGAHEHGWRLEPLVFARIWLDHVLSDSDKKWIDRMIERGAAFLVRVARNRPEQNLQFNNRGAVWSAVTQLCGLYLNDDRCLNAVNEHAERIMRHSVGEDGQVKEATLQYLGGGPDANYTYTGWTYVQMYRLLSGRDDLDDLLLNAVRWLVRWNANTGHALASAASVRQANYPVSKIVDVFHALEFYADREPIFSRVIDRWWDASGKMGGHCIHPLIWPLLAHRNVKAPRREPAWYADAESHFSNPPSQYSLFAHRYQTAVTYRGIKPSKGIQTFAYGDEPPIILHTDELASGTRAGGSDTAVQSVTGTDEGWEIFIRQANAQPGYEAHTPCTYIVTRRDKLWELYCFTTASVVYLVGGVPGPYHTRWMLNGLNPAKPKLDRRGKRMTFAGRKGCIVHPAASRATLTTISETPAFELVHKTGPAIFALAGGDLNFTKIDRRAQSLDFTDLSGSYHLDFKDMLTKVGDLNRRPWHRVTTQ